MSVLTLDDTVKTYSGIHALDHLSLDVAAGEIHAIVGLNGAGKTTAMRAALGQISLDSGTVSLCGEAPGTRGFGRLGFVVDQPFGYPEMTVRANIATAARLHGLARDDATVAAARWIGALKLSAWADKPARGLSLGNRTRLGLACALAHEPDVVILDEPTNALDPAGILLLRATLLEAAARGAGVLVSSHHLDEVARVADRITVIHAGTVIGSLEPEEVDLERRFFEAVRRWDRGRGVAAPLTDSAPRRPSEGTRS